MVCEKLPEVGAEAEVRAHWARRTRAPVRATPELPPDKKVLVPKVRGVRVAWLAWAGEEVEPPDSMTTALVPDVPFLRKVVVPITEPETVVIWLAGSRFKVRSQLVPVPNVQLVAGLLGLPRVNMADTGFPNVVATVPLAPAVGATLPKNKLVAVLPVSVVMPTSATFTAQVLAVIWPVMVTLAWSFVWACALR